MAGLISIAGLITVFVARGSRPYEVHVATKDAYTLQRELAAATGMPLSFEGLLGIRFVLLERKIVEAGRFLLYVAACETTNRQYRAIVPSHRTLFRAGHAFPLRLDGSLELDGDDQPVAGVTVSAIQQYMMSLNSVDTAVPARQYRLPTASEWRRACLAGATTKWSFGDRMEDIVEYGNVCDLLSYNWLPDCGEFDDGYSLSASVASFLPNGLGVYDMHGNIAEICHADDGVERYDGDSEFVSCGGSWFLPADACAADRVSRLEARFISDMRLGFRVLCEVPLAN